jgi:hypothetical protein
MENLSNETWYVLMDVDDYEDIFSDYDNVTDVSTLNCEAYATSEGCADVLEYIKEEAEGCVSEITAHFKCRDNQPGACGKC